MLSARHHFPGTFGKTFLDAACCSLTPRPAVEAIEKFLDLAMVCPHESSTAHHIFMDEMRAVARPAIARLINAREDEIALVVEQARAQREQQVDETFLEAPQVFADDGEPDENGEFDPDEDPLLDKAIEVVVTAQTASVSLLQRRLRVGYTRAGRLIDMLERRGIISPYEGSKPRRVLVSEHDLERVVTGSVVD